MAIRGIKTKIAFNVAFLVLVSAIITDLLMVVVVQSMLIRQEVERSRQILNTIGHHIIFSTTQLSSDQQKEADTITGLLSAATQLTTIQVADGSGGSRYQQENHNFPISLLNKATQVTLHNHQSMVKDIGMVWAGFWWHPRAVIISVPIKTGTQYRGAVSGISVLTPIYQRVAQFNKSILLYIIINTVLLTLIGLYRIFRLYLRPIDRIVCQADDYREDGDLFFAVRHEDNQLNRLSSSLNRMLNRIKADKETLQTTVVSLEQANTALKNAQKKIIQAEKMASVGRLASGIAHEIGNPIGIVLGYLDLLKKNGLEPSDKKDFLRRAEDEVQRINTVIRQLLDLARPKDSNAQQVNLNEVIQDIMEVMRMQPSMSGIRFETQFNHGQAMLWANADQLRQVFLNLLLNAVDAIQSRETAQKGQIIIHTRCLDARDADQRPYVQIVFEDNGIGMDQESLGNIFDPFYTTKEPGKGTGLGLAVSFMIIEGMDGTIVVASEPGQGSTLTVELPLAKHEAAQANLSNPSSS
jgi:two-component system, NtrC family, sensor kinase